MTSNVLALTRLASGDGRRSSLEGGSRVSGEHAGTYKRASIDSTESAAAATTRHVSDRVRQQHEAGGNSNLASDDDEEEEEEDPDPLNSHSWDSLIPATPGSDATPPTTVNVKRPLLQRVTLTASSPRGYTILDPASISIPSTPRNPNPAAATAATATVASPSSPAGGLLLRRLPSSSTLASQLEAGRRRAAVKKSTAEDIEHMSDDLLADEIEFDVNPEPDGAAPVDLDDVPLLPDLPPLPSLPSGVRGIENTRVWLTGSFKTARVVLQKMLRMQWPGYVMLAMALFAVSSMGVATLSMKGVAPVLKGSWRAQATFLYMLPLFMYQLVRTRPSQLRSFVLDRSLVLNFAVVTMGGITWAATFFVALQYTSLAHAYLFSNITCILIVLYRMAARLPVARLEAIGAFVGVLGGALTIMGRDALDPADTTPPPLNQIVLGDFIAFLGSIGGVFYLMFGSNLRAKVPIFIYMLPLTLCNCIFFVVLSTLLEGSDMSRDAFTGAFGWLTYQWFGAASYLGIVTGLLGFVSYVAVLKFVPAIVVSVVMLLEPIIAVIFAVMFGVSAFPDVFTIIGGIVLVGGTLMVTWSTRNQIQSPPADHPTSRSQFAAESEGDSLPLMPLVGDAQTSEHAVEASPPLPLVQSPKAAKIQ